MEKMGRDWSWYIPIGACLIWWFDYIWRKQDKVGLIQQVAGLWDSLIKRLWIYRNLHSPNRRPEKISWDLLGVIKPPQVQEIPSTLLEAGTVRGRHQHRLPHFNIDWPVAAAFGDVRDWMAAPKFLTFVDVYTKIPQKWLLELTLLLHRKTWGGI